MLKRCADYLSAIARLWMDTGEPLPLMEKRFADASSLPNKDFGLGLLGQQANLNLVSAENIDVASSDQ